MFNVKVDTIRERTTNGPTYMKGRQYYRQGHVKHIAYDQKKGIIMAQVEGTRMYDVRIILNSQGELHDATCTCSAFAAYWGLCRHITAALLYCIDAFTGQKEPAVQNNQIKAAPAASVRRSQSQRRNRSKTRDFLTRLDHACRISVQKDKKPVALKVILFCPRSTSHAPWLSFAIGRHHLHTVTNVEQFAEAISRDLPLELDQDFTFDPVRHYFRSQDMPLIRMLCEAFENDYKSVFGLTSTTSRDHCFVLNASRLASFLKFSGQLSDSSWLSNKNEAPQSIRICESGLPLRLSLEPAEDEQAESPYQLKLLTEEPIQQVTASRNVYLAGDTFYLPPYEQIRLLEPVLATFAKPGFHHLQLSRDEVIALLSNIRPQLMSACPIDIHPSIEEQIVEKPLRSVVHLDFDHNHLKANVSFHYGDTEIPALVESASDQESNQLVVRNQIGEQRVIDALQSAGFSQYGQTYRLSDMTDTYHFLDKHLNQLETIAEVRRSPSAEKIKILPPPDIHFDFSLPDEKDQLFFEQDYGHLSPRMITAYLRALQRDESFFRRPDGSFQQVDTRYRPLFQQIMETLDFWQIRPSGGLQQLPAYRALALHHLLQQYPDAGPLTISENLKQLINHLNEPGSLRFRTPQQVSALLRPYQKTGFRWLCTLDYYGLGGILADDMGLGKTLQTIAFITYIWQKYKRNAIIIAPTSLIYNWASEFERFAPHLSVAIIDGNRQQRNELLQNNKDKACLITSYSLLRRDIDAVQPLHFGCCFIDEAQNIKNPDTLNARSVKQIQADRYFALTGTPIENTLTELWSIFDFILPGYLHSQSQFQNYFEWPITRDQNEDRMTSLRHMISPFLLRRMKTDVLQELPQKIETRSICDMTDEQRSLYQDFLDRSRRDLSQELKVSGFARSQIYILALLTRLRQICCHPGLFIRDYDGGSGKLSMLDELLADSFAGGHRVLLFSQFTQMLDIIRTRLEAQNETPLYIDGQIPAEERLRLVDRFNGGEGRIFLISLRAGGTGLNLTGADTVIHFDPWWNPAVEEQATDRVYRIGQENVVQVIKLYTRHSVEEKIYRLQERKQKLVDALIQPGQNLLSKMSLDEVLSLFEIQDSRIPRSDI